MLGAWAGHVTAQRDIDALAGRGRRATCAIASCRPARADACPTSGVREIPLAVVMVALTTLTLWSLGQSIVVRSPRPARPPRRRRGARAGR